MSREVASLELNDLQPGPADHVAPESELPGSTSQSEVRQSHAIIVILQLTAITVLTSITTGLMTVSVPRIASDLNIQPKLYYWSAYLIQGLQEAASI